MPKAQFQQLAMDAGEQVYYRPRRVTRYPAS
jgi:hypothetical protein